MRAVSQPPFLSVSEIFSAAKKVFPVPEKK
jgi:hypothetical protein